MAEAEDLAPDHHGAYGSSSLRNPVAVFHVKRLRFPQRWYRDRPDPISQWGDPELDKAQAETDAIFAEIDGLNELVENESTTMEQAQARFMELLEKNRLVGERLLEVARAWGATPGHA